MANTVQVQVLADVKNMVNGINQTNKQLGGLGDKVGKVTSAVKGMVAGFIAFQGVQAAVGFLKDSIGAASDLQETVSKSNTIFGDQAAAINKWASSAATNVGLSKSAALEAAAGFGNMFTQLGFAGTEAASMSTKVVQMSADLGSFNNLPTADVADRMSAAFRGEFDSLQALIPNINAARVEQEAMAMTGKTSADALTAQEKAAATLAIVNRDGALAMGDFAKTSDGFANKQKILQAKLEDVKAVIGNALLPIVTAFVGFITDKGIPAAQAFATWFGDNLVPALQNLWSTIQANVLPILQSMGDYITGTIVPALSSMVGFIQENSTLFGTLAVVLGTLYAGFVVYNTALAIWSSLTKGYAAVQLAFNAIMAINPFVLIIIGLTALVAGLIYAWKNSETFRNVVTGVWNAVKGAVMGVLNWFTGTLWPGIQNVYNFIKNGVQTVLSIYISVWAKIISTVMSVPGRIIGFFAGIPGFFTGLWDKVKSGAVNGFNAVVDFVRGIPGRITSAVGNLGSLLLNAGKDIIAGLLKGITSKIGAVKDTLTGLTGKLTSWKGPESLDKVILLGAGQLVIGGFIKGLESQYKNVKQSLNSLTGDIAGTSFGSPSMALAGGGSAGFRTGNTYNLTVNVAPGADPAQAGREVIKAIQAAESQDGAVWRTRR